MIDLNKPTHLIIGSHFRDPPAPSATESTSDILNAYVNYLPGIMQATNAQTTPTAQAQLAASQAVSPGQNQLALDLYKQFGPQFAQAGSNVDDLTRKATAATDVGILDTSGRQLADIYKQIDQGLNPEYYSVRQSAGNRLNEILGTSLDAPNVEAERLINQENERSGNATAPSATNTTANALQFEDQRQKRISNLSNAISTATQFLQPASNAQFNPATAALGKPTSNAGVQQFAGVNANAGSQATQTTNQFLGQLGQTQQNQMNINSNRRDVIDRINEGFSSL